MCLLVPEVDIVAHLGSNRVRMQHFGFSGKYFFITELLLDLDSGEALLYTGASPSFPSAESQRWLLPQACLHTVLLRVWLVSECKIKRTSELMKVILL